MRRRDRIIRGLLRHRMLLTTHDERTWEGLVMDVDDRFFVLREAVAVSVDGRIPADGEVLLPREDVSYVQMLPERQ